MVKQVNKINKDKYDKKNNSTVYIIAGIAIALIIGVAAYLGTGGSINAVAGPAPSGTNCPENIAYLQKGVNSYKELTGQVATELNQLVQTVNGKGPFVEELPACPSGNIYFIENGVVKEGVKQ
jgi:hypothetical protein